MPLSSSGDSLIKRIYGCLGDRFRLIFDAVLEFQRFGQEV